MYGFKMDIWGAGCVLYEILSRTPLFPGNNELDQINRIHTVIGTPEPILLSRMLQNRRHGPMYTFAPKQGTGIRQLLPSMSTNCILFLQSMLEYDPEIRITSQQALQSPFFEDKIPAVQFVLN